MFINGEKIRLTSDEKASFSHLADRPLPPLHTKADLQRFVDELMAEYDSDAPDEQLYRGILKSFTDNLLSGELLQAS